jgi:uncharacterized protein YlxW (UPF0749 family)
MRKTAFLMLILILVSLATVLATKLVIQVKKVDKQTETLWARKQPLLKSKKGLFFRVPPEDWG